MARYPHMLKNEVVIWEKFLAEHGPRYDKFEYDVHVGSLYPEHEVLDTAWKRGAAAVYQKRIDAVGFQPGVIEIFEVKPHAGLSALGQVLGYLALYDEDFEPFDELRATVVTGLIDPGTRLLLTNHGIGIYEFRE